MSARLDLRQRPLGGRRSALSTTRRSLELAALFGALPAALAWGFARPPVVPPLILGGAACFALLWRDPDFDRRRLWNAAALPRALPGILLRLALGGTVLALATAWLLPDDLFALPRRDPALWAVVMIGYPLVSVWPQEVVFRAFFLHRYRGLLGGAALAASAVAFAWAHVLFRNPLAVALTLPAGLLFAATYRRHRSLACAVVEHALWGDLVFTLGLGRFFYSGLVG